MSWVAQVWNPGIQESESHSESLSQKRNTRKHLKGNRQTVSGMHGWCTEGKVQPSVATPWVKDLGLMSFFVLMDSVSKTGRDFCRCSFGFRTSHYTQEGEPAFPGGLVTRPEGRMLGWRGSCFSEVPQCWWYLWDKSFQGREDFFRGLRRNTDGRQRMLSSNIDYTGRNSPSKSGPFLSIASGPGSLGRSSGVRVASWRRNLERQMSRGDVSLFMLRVILTSLIILLKFKQRIFVDNLTFLWNKEGMGLTQNFCLRPLQ